MEKIPNYTPLPEEITKIEQNLLSAEKQISLKREAMFDGLKKMGKTGYIESYENNCGKGVHGINIVGVINGHTIELWPYEGIIDGIKISREDTDSLREKYHDVVYSPIITSEPNSEGKTRKYDGEEMARQELREEGKKVVSQTVKELLS